MKIHKMITILGIGAGSIALVVAFILRCPGSISGAWTGPMVSCMCDAHNFVVTDNGKCVSYFDGETNSPPQLTFCERSGVNAWTWRVTELLPKGDSEVGVRTNDYIITPHLLHADVLIVSDGTKTRLFRDFRKTDMDRVRAQHSQPEEIEFFRARMEAALLCKERTASNRLPAD